MKAFEYAQPSTEGEALELLATSGGETELLAGGTDLVGLMKRMVVTPDRVVNVAEIPSMKTIQRDATLGGLAVGAAVHLDELLDSPLLDEYTALRQAIDSIGSIQEQCQGTLGGDLLSRPRCWYFRDGHGLLADGGRMVVEGDNRYHAILGNLGPAKFVNASRLAPALISLGAHVRVLGPRTADEQFLPLEELYRTPRHDGQRENVLAANQLVTHVLLPPLEGRRSGAYDVRHGEGPDPPLAAAAATILVAGGVVREAKVVLGQVAPTPWIADDAARKLLGRAVNPATAEMAGQAAVAAATPLSENEYKVQLAEVAATRAILLAAGLPTGGF